VKEWPEISIPLLVNVTRIGEMLLDWPTDCEGGSEVPPMTVVNIFPAVSSPELVLVMLWPES
jgi:hypothetical protein